MEDTLQSGLRQDQWFSSRTTSEKLLEKRSNSLGSGALHFIRTRSSIRRELKRHCNQSKSSESTSSNNEGGNGGGGVGGLGKWLREHLGGGSRGSHDVSVPLPAKRTGSADKSLTRVTYASQNLYCSLPREHGRHCHNVRKHVQPGLHSRPRSNSANFHDKSHSGSPRAPFIGTITRGGPIYGSEGKTIKRRNRDRRRHSLNETQDGSQNHRQRCIPDGGDVGYTMTELQPSPPGYRGQDEAPGPPSCSSASFKYSTHAGHPESGSYKGTAYLRDHYGKDSYGKPSSRSPSDYYHDTNDIGRRDVELNGKKVSGYMDGYKKNAPGYKNDSGYSESLGFDSFSLPLNERDESSPPPTPPVRDASSLKGVCYGPGHEKYPSWPSAPERHPDEELHSSSGHSGSHRSKSWTDHTNYPKEKPAQYTRPHMKRPNPAFTQQLKTVMERCEKIPAETFESRGRNNVDEEPRLWPRVDREGKPLGDAEYVVPSPPEREQQTTQTLSHADLEAYVRSYQDPQVDLYQETTLTQAGLEEYTRVQHSQQASYAQSEGYHSYVSSVDSTTNTPFLDRLRRDSEAVAQRPTSTWDDSREGRDSVVTTSSGSASSSETLKWHGSMSDVSVSSGLPARQSAPEKWHHGSMSDVSMNGLAGKQNNVHEKWQGSMSDVSSSGMSPLKSRHATEKWQDKWQNSMNERNKRGRSSLPPVIANCNSAGDICQGHEGKWQESSIDEEAHERMGNSKNQWESSGRSDQEKYSSLPQPMPQSPTQSGLAGPQSPENWTGHHGSMSDVSANGVQGSKQLIAHSARVQTPQRHHSESVLYLDRERNQRKLYPVSTTQPQDIAQPRMAPTSPQQPQLSVAERINELEKQQQQQQMRYTYLDPEKRHRVSDPTLKAIQKKALLSFYERHHQASWRSEPQLAQGATPTPQSPPPQPPPRPRPPSSRRASSASDYASGTWREKTGRGQSTSDMPSPKHQHSSSCGSLSTDLLGPVIVGPAISIDDWVPERPPKKPHLRNVFNDRVPSPDLPPPSPPTVTENEVLNCDDPLPPPPPELSDNPSETKEPAPSEDKKRDHPERHKAQPERQSVRRSKHGKRDHEKTKSSPVTTPTKSQQFVRGSSVKHVDSEMVLENGVTAGYATHRMVATGRSSLRYPSTQKLMVNGRVAPVRRISEERLFPTRPPAQLPDLISQRYSDSGNQRPSPQVPVEPRIIRQESMRVESTRIDASGLLRNDSQRLESSSGQRPQPQVPKGGEKGPQPTRPNYLAIPENTKISKYPENAHNFTIGSPIKTSYEASSKLFAEGSPQKYHEPPKYVPNLQRHSETPSRNYYALPPKYVDAPKQKPQPQSPSDRYGGGSPTSPPPPLAPRQNTPGRKSLPPPPRPAPPLGQQGSQSKASYLAYRRERGAPDSEGSYKRTMSPTARLDDWPPPRDRDDPVLLRVTPHHPHPLHHPELPKSHSVDALHHRLEERTAHSVEVISKLSHDLNKKLQASEVRRGENNNLEERRDSGPGDVERKERLSLQSVEVLNDRNRQLERERRKLAASCEPSAGQKRLLERESLLAGEDFYRERTSTIEMTSQNVEMLNRRNVTQVERRVQEVRVENGRLQGEINVDTRPPPVIEKPPPPTTSPPRTPEPERRESPVTKTGAVPRRSGSCSSSSSGRSTELRTSPSTLPTRSSPRSSPLNSPTRTDPRLPEGSNPIELISISSRRKVSGLTQTDTSSLDRMSSSGSSSPTYTKSSQTSESEISTKKFEATFSRTSRTSISPVSTISKSSSSPRTTPVDPILIEDKSTTTSPCVSPQPGIEGLTLVQRTEVVLRVNAATSDAASQTEVLSEENALKKKTTPDPTPEPRKKLPEEIECEELSRDLASQLNPNDKLVSILVPVPEHRRPTDYVSGLFRVEATIQPRPTTRLSLDDSSISITESSMEEEKKIETASIPSTPTTPSVADPGSPLSPTSAYFTTSEGKARFLTRYSRDVSEEPVANGTDETGVATPVLVTDSLDLKQKKEELMVRLDKKLVVLRAEQEAVREEGDVNEALGARVATRVTAVARPAEASKYRLHVEEIGKITSLLLGLSGRLARAENALYGMPADHAERKILESKRDKLIDQLEEAKILKSNIDKRSVNVSAILAKYLNDEEFADYQHFINMKAKLIMDGREIQDKVKLGEEQLAALKEAID
ncbi:serine/arginine repetitive matrix protein 2 isoform X2 [Cephus cinctus]|uniref:Serine/arginine repetitive matrix protein 2 isoform X2 n=1 Tax=Cephus cinctus TaxID=211228 RepID=A0AAJ7RNA7_CEPCN|nr:serine/arginine repetitive matrix protein 2 isoform X2 [Cephus cinctus]